MLSCYYGPHPAFALQMIRDRADLLQRQAAEKDGELRDLRLEVDEQERRMRGGRGRTGTKGELDILRAQVTLPCCRHAECHVRGSTSALTSFGPHPPPPGTAPCPHSMPRCHAMGGDVHQCYLTHRSASCFWTTTTWTR